MADTPTAIPSGGPVDKAVIEDFVAASRILAYHGVLDAWGHVSIRHPANPERYLMSRARAPALVSAEDIMEFDLDSNPVDQHGAVLRQVHPQPRQQDGQPEHQGRGHAIRLCG